MRTASMLSMPLLDAIGAESHKMPLRFACDTMVVKASSSLSRTNVAVDCCCALTPVSVEVHAVQGLKSYVLSLVAIRVDLCVHILKR